MGPSEQRPRLSGRCHPALHLCLFAVLGLGVVASAMIPIPTVKSKPRGITGVTIDIKKGIPPETVVSNITTRTAITTGKADAVTFSGLTAGSTNQFISYNTTGSSAVLSAIATNQVIASRITVHSYRVEVPIKQGQATRVMMSTNLLTWYQIALVLSTNTTYQFIWTNDGAPQRYFRGVSP